MAGTWQCPWPEDAAGKVCEIAGIAAWLVCPRQIFDVFCAQSKTTAKILCDREM